MSFIIENEWLLNQLDQPNIRVADCRFNLNSSEEGYQLYLKDHIPGAVYFDLGKDLSSPVSLHGGRHPLPNMEDFKETLQNAGISNETTVIAYDGGEGSFAGRLWWLLKYAGHENVFVLNGGYRGWKEADYPVETDVTEFTKSVFNIQLNDSIFASYQEVKKIVEGNSHESILIDSRENKRYLGIVEPIDKKAGHIPGAKNKVWTDCFENRLFKSAEEQAKRFSDLDKEREIIVYCGSGVTATPNFMALKAAGFKNVKLYAGSFSDWISYDENEIETERKN